MLMMLWFVIRVWNCSFPHCSFRCGILKKRFFLKVFQRQNSSASQPMSFSFYLAHLPFLWMTAEVALCHQNGAQCVCYNKKAGEEEVVRKLCPCSAVGIFQESTASSLTFSICLDIWKCIHRKDCLCVPYFLRRRTTLPDLKKGKTMVRLCH